ncbi:PAS domain-containing protein [uncultured Sphingomonas sp.]|uniref:helix-turn-helix transcriptional regulator n=1 Tax=uncultured Sphingomonas sp. TaxID=158754 RepID=UPI0025EA253E|nr:PAS domain-containing protein [uncultured Sphingomonas sp.]
MSEVVDIMQAQGATLTLHNDAQPPVRLYQHPALRMAGHESLLRECHALVPTLDDGRLTWHGGPSGSRLDAALIPIERVPGHSRLAITLVFENGSSALKARVEAVYGERKPFAVGYFHLWQLNRLHMRRYRALEAALDCTQIGVLLVDRSLQIIFANKAAEEILAANDGLGRHNGRLRATHISDGVNLQAALSCIELQSDSRFADTGQAPLIAFRRKKLPSLVATFVPAHAIAPEPGDVVATIYVVDPRLDTVRSLTPLCRLYGLSPVETRLVCHLAAGETLAAAADQMHIREQTARSYLKQIFIKTDTNRQTELVVLMLSSLLRMKDDVLQEALTQSAAEHAIASYSKPRVREPHVR